MISRAWNVWLCSLAIVTCASAVEAGAHPKYPRRYQRGSIAEYQVFPRNGKVVVRQAYNGYTNHFPMPNYLFEGYPHGGSYGQVFNPGSGY